MNMEGISIIWTLGIIPGTDVEISEYRSMHMYSGHRHYTSEYTLCMTPGIMYVSVCVRVCVCMHVCMCGRAADID